MYSTAGYSKDAYKEQVADSVALKAKGEPHPKIWLPDAQNEDYYLIDMPGIPVSTSNTSQPHARARLRSRFAGDDKYDISDGTGVCTDTHYDYMHTGCESRRRRGPRPCAHGLLAARRTPGATSVRRRWSTLTRTTCDTWASSSAASTSARARRGVDDQRHRAAAPDVLEPARLHGQVRLLERQARDRRAALAAGVRALRPAVPAATSARRSLSSSGPCATTSSAHPAGGRICLNPVACVCQVRYAHAPAHLFATYKLQTRQLRRCS